MNMCHHIIVTTGIHIASLFQESVLFLLIKVFLIYYQTVTVWLTVAINLKHTQLTFSGIVLTTSIIVICLWLATTSKEKTQDENSETFASELLKTCFHGTSYSSCRVL